MTRPKLIKKKDINKDLWRIVNTGHTPKRINKSSSNKDLITVEMGSVKLKNIGNYSNDSMSQEESSV